MLAGGGATSAIEIPPSPAPTPPLCVCVLFSSSSDHVNARLGSLLLLTVLRTAGNGCKDFNERDEQTKWKSFPEEFLVLHPRDSSGGPVVLLTQSRIAANDLQGAGLF